MTEAAQSVSAVFLPLAAAIIAGLVADRRAAWTVTIGAVLVSAILSWSLFREFAGTGRVATVTLASWIDSGSLKADWALRLDALSVTMMAVVTTISAIVHVYSVGYMAHDPHVPRFMAWLSLFTFAMLMLVTADNFIQLFLGWEGVGLSSYLLIGFWYRRPAANAAAIKAFLVNRVGDLGFALGILTLFIATHAVDFDTVLAAAPEMARTTVTIAGITTDVLTIATLLLFVGAAGKSAQLPLHTWLPDAMEGPTPVSALIHAATMVTAGVFMLARCSPLFALAPATQETVVIIGASTALLAGTIAITQNDIKRIIAWSTCSQLGYMFVAAGLSAWPVAIFHLFTHAFFKALLFLGAGSVIHAAGGEQDIRRMGGLFQAIPQTTILMWIGALSLAGIPLLSGYYSKDAIIDVAFASATAAGDYALVLGLAAALLTALYSWRLLFLVFHGPARHRDNGTPPRESPPVMLVPLYLLATGAVFAGIMFFPVMAGEGWQTFWGPAISASASDIMDSYHHVPLWVRLSPLLAAVAGIWMAWRFHVRNPDIPRALAARNPGLYRFLCDRWRFDELYDMVFVRPARTLGRVFWQQGDGTIINGLGPDGLSALVADMAARLRLFQTGYLYHYALVMLTGVTLMLLLFLFWL